MYTALEIQHKGTYNQSITGFGSSEAPPSWLQMSSLKLWRTCFRGLWSLGFHLRALLGSGSIKKPSSYISKQVDKLNHFISHCVVDGFDLFSSTVELDPRRYPI